MKVETKFSRGDKIFFLNPINTKIIQLEVQGLRVELGVKDETPHVLYFVNDISEQQINVKVEESRAFKTKEELLKSL